MEQLLKYVLRQPGITTEWNGLDRFAIDAAHHFEDEEWAVEIFCKDRQVAQEAAEALETYYGCVRLYEWGSYRTQGNGSSQPGWIAYWWSDTDYVGNQPPGSGYGLPSGKSEIRPYEPVTP